MISTQHEWFMTKLKVYIVEEQAIFRAGIKQTLASLKEKLELTEITNCTQLLTLLEAQQPDMIIMNPGTNENSISITEQLIKKYEKIKVLLFTDHADDEILVKLINSGLYGCLLRSAELGELKLAIEMALTNQCYFSPQLINRLLFHRVAPHKNGTKRNQSETPLTEREREIIKLICKGFDQQEIAEKLFISPRTVDAHKANIMSKLEVKNTTGIILHAIKKHLIQLEELA